MIGLVHHVRCVEAVELTLYVSPLYNEGQACAAEHACIEHDSYNVQSQTLTIRPLHYLDNSVVYSVL